MACIRTQVGGYIFGHKSSTTTTSSISRFYNYGIESSPAPRARRKPLSTSKHSPWPTYSTVRRWFQALAPFLFFALLTVTFAWPVVSQLNGVIVGDDQDVFINPWADWWTFQALTRPELTLWATDYLFFPRGTSLHFHSFSHLTSLVSLALRPLLGALAAYNATILLHLVLAGLAMYHFGRYITGSVVAGLLAGIVFAFNSHNILQTAHPVLVSVWPLPWSGLFLLQAIDHNDHRRALLAAGVVLLAALCSTLMLVLTGLWLIFLLGFALVTGRIGRDTLPTLALFAFASVGFVLLPLYPLLQEAVVSANTAFVVDAGPSTPTDVLAPIRLYWRGLFARSLHFGLVPLLLIGASLLRRRQTWPWLLFLVIVYLFAIGPEPLVARQQTAITLPWSDAVRPLLRHTHRLNVLMSAALAALVAYGWTALAEKLHHAPKARWLLALLLATFIYAEYNHPNFPYRTPTVSSFYTEYLEQVPDDVALAILPTGRQQDKLYMHFQTVHGHKMTNGVVSRHDPEAFHFTRNNDLLRAGSVNLPPVDLPDDPIPALQELADAGIDFLILDKPHFEQQELDLRRWRELMPDAPVYEDDLVVVFPTSPNR